MNHGLPAGSMLMQTRGAEGGGDSKSVECLLSFTPLPGSKSGSCRNRLSASNGFCQAVAPQVEIQSKV